MPARNISVRHTIQAEIFETFDGELLVFENRCVYEGATAAKKNSATQFK
jgi:hypothetical protein